MFGKKKNSRNTRQFNDDENEMLPVLNGENRNTSQEHAIDRNTAHFQYPSVPESSRGGVRNHSPESLPVGQSMEFDS